MEKLQQALDKARAAREAPPAGAQPRNAPGPARGARPAPATAGATEIDAAWAALAPLTLDPKALRQNRLMSLEACREATPFDILRTKILQQMRRNGWKRLAITSPSAGCGKTTTALNLALGLTRQPDLRALVLEMDLRRPSMSSMLDHRPETDIIQMLTGAVPFAEQAVRMRSNVAVSMARRSSKDPTRYMTSQETVAALAGLERDYDPDLVIYDMPPLLVSDDTRAFLDNVDCALMVARAEQSSIAQIDTCEREIAEHTNMLGVVLGHCRFSDETESYDYEYN